MAEHGYRALARVTGQFARAGLWRIQSAATWRCLQEQLEQLPWGRTWKPQDENRSGAQRRGGMEAMQL
jgi:hypothetical protein